MTHTGNAFYGVMSKKEAELRQIFLEQVQQIPAGDRISRCIQCGTCTGSCPVSYTMDISPRELIALFRAGDMESIMKSRTIWICASCYACTTRCPSGIKITDIIYALKRTAMETKYQTRAPHVQILAKLFIENLKKYGRLHEGTLIRKYYTKTKARKLLGLVPLGRKMRAKGRVEVFPKKIKGRKALARIIDKAHEIDMREAPDKLPYQPGHVGYGAVGDMQLEIRKGD
jgi:heterodisulfide reductase subunit C